MDDSLSNVSNVLLALCLDLKSPNNPLQPRSGPLVQGGQYHLVAGVLGRGYREASAPVTGMVLDKDRCNSYNRVLEKFSGISQMFRQRGGFVDKPESYTAKQQIEVMTLISAVGRDIFDLFKDSPIQGWLNDLWKLNPATRDRPSQIPPLTIITNDFNVPWFWLNAAADAPLLCEVCPLGILQLSAAGSAAGLRAPIGRDDKNYEALLIKGSAGLPFVEEEFRAIKAALEDAPRNAPRKFKVQCACNPDEISKLGTIDKDHLLSSFRIVHLAGHYSGQILNAGTMAFVLNSSLLVLDGHSSPGTSDGWGDLKGLVSKITNTGSLGCVLNVLPVKHDPIASNLLWENFYRQLKQGTLTIGQALANARIELRNHFRDIGSPNPMWAVYQLIGSPAVHLCYEDTKPNG